MSDDKPDDWAGTIKGKLQAGQVAERSRTTSMKDIESFTEMTGDRNPLHYDRELAEKSPFGKLIVQGGVTSGILNALVAEDLPGRGGDGARRQADLHHQDGSSQRRRRDLPDRNRHHLHDAVGWDLVLFRVMRRLLNREKV